MSRNRTFANRVSDKSASQRPVSGLKDKATARDLTQSAPEMTARTRSTRPDAKCRCSLVLVPAYTALTATCPSHATSLNDLNSKLSFGGLRKSSCHISISYAAALERHFPDLVLISDSYIGAATQTQALQAVTSVTQILPALLPPSHQRHPPRPRLDPTQEPMSPLPPSMRRVVCVSWCP